MWPDFRARLRERAVSPPRRGAPRVPTAAATTGEFPSSAASVLVASNAHAPPYVTLISASPTPSQDAVVAQIKFPTATGIEQSLYDAATKELYVKSTTSGSS